MELTKMTRYTPEERTSMVQDYHNSGLSLREYAAANGIAKSTLYTWCTQTTGNPKPMKTSTLSAEQRFQIILETAKYSEEELGKYCRSQGLFSSDIHAWQQACIAATKPASPIVGTQNKADKKRIKQLEKELNRKDKALAETTALLVLRKKFNAIYGLDEEL